MLEDHILDLAKKLNSKIKEVENSLSDKAFNHFVEDLMEKEVNLSDASEDLSDTIRARISQLSRAGKASAEIIRILKASASPKFVTLNTVANEIASVTVGDIEVGLSSDLLRNIQSLSRDEFLELKRKVKAQMPSQKMSSLTVSCRLDRWALVVDEDKFIENSQLSLEVQDR